MNLASKMLLTSLFTSLLTLTTSLPAAQSSTHDVLPGAPSGFAYEEFAHAHAWPSIHESTVAARRILKLHGISTLSSIFPVHGEQRPSNPESPDSKPNLSRFEAAELYPYADRPGDVAGAPIGLMDYHASCGPTPFDPLIIGMTIATTMRNAASGSNVTLSMRYHLPSPPSPAQPPKDKPYAYLPANLPRFSLIGYLERIDPDEVKRYGLDTCFYKTHPDAHLWAPGGELEPHESWWARIRVREIYFFGGFGDRARIGWLPLSEWQSVTEQEVNEFRLPGEKGWLKQEAAAMKKAHSKSEQQVIEITGDDDDEEWEDPLFMHEL